MARGHFWENFSGSGICKQVQCTLSSLLVRLLITSTNQMDPSWTRWLKGILCCWWVSRSGARVKRAINQNDLASCLAVLGHHKRWTVNTVTILTKSWFPCPPNFLYHLLRSLYLSLQAGVYYLQSFHSTSSGLMALPLLGSSFTHLPRPTVRPAGRELAESFFDIR